MYTLWLVKYNIIHLVFPTGVNIFLNMALTQDSYFVSFETVKFYNWIVIYFFFKFQLLQENCVMGMP